jgi:hypothetical protein
VGSKTKTEIFYWTLSGLIGHCPTVTDFVRPSLNQPHCHRECIPDFVRLNRTLSGIQILAQQLVPFELSIYIPSPPMARISWPDEIPVLKAHFLHSKGLIHSILEHSLQVLDLGFERNKDLSFMCDSPPQAHHGS